MSKVKFVYFDAANTLIHKPDLWTRWDEVLRKHKYFIEKETLKRVHKLTSEKIEFPDRTSEEFYANFNAEVLRGLNISPDKEMVSDIFNACTYLPWCKFDDVVYLNKMEVPLGIISNFNKTLEEKITKIIDIRFKEFVVSEVLGFAKPNNLIFEYAIGKANVHPSEILFVGDSIKIDILPAQQMGMQVCLIDRENIYPKYENRIKGFNELKNFFKQHL